jgi:hypothetical protein
MPVTAIGFPIGTADDPAFESRGRLGDVATADG